MAIPGAILQPLSLAVTGSFYPELFDDPRLRLSGVSLGRQFGTILGGGLMPLISTSLLAMSGGSLTIVIGYFVLIGLGGPEDLAVPVAVALTLMFLAAMLGSGILGVLIERFAYRRLRNAPRIAPRRRRSTSGWRPTGW